MSYSKKRSRSRASALALCGLAVAWAIPPVEAQTCTQEQISGAINAAGEKLRQMTAQTQPLLQTKLLKLKEINGWSDVEYEEKGYNLLEDQRTAKLDATANELLGRLDQMSGEAAAASPDCGKLAEIEAASLELQATVKAKSQYILARLDQLIGDGKTTAATPVAPAIAAAPKVAAPPAAKAEPKADPKWATSTKSSPHPVAPAVAPVASATTVTPAPAPSVSPPNLPPVSNTPAPDAEGFSIDEIVAASHGVFGKVSANVARVLEHTFSKSGKPSAYILGSETGGAFIAGLRYGSGTLYMRTGQSMPIYWHGPSLGADVGAQGAATLFLVYKAQQLEDVFSSYTGLEGSAFVVGGVGVTYMSNGRIEMAPIRSGLGLRVGASIGYVRFTQKPTWNPF
jgi:hypothetical protein